MSSSKINPAILDRIQEQSEGDKAIEQFLIDLIYEEADHPGQWWWKETYKKQIEKHSSDWEAHDED